MSETVPADDLTTRIEALSDAEIDKVLAALTAALKHRAEATLADDPAARAALDEAARPEAAKTLVAEWLPADATPPSRRELLLALAATPGLEEEVRGAMQHRQFVAFGLLEISAFAAITFVLTTTFDLRIERNAEGKLTWKVEARKKPTALSFLGRLFGLGGAAEPEDSEAPKKPAAKPPKPTPKPAKPAAERAPKR